MVWHTGRGKILLNTVVRFRSFSCSVSFQCSKLSSCRRCYWRAVKGYISTNLSSGISPLSVFTIFIIHLEMKKKKTKKTFRRLILSVCSPLLQFIGFIAGTENRRREYKLSDFFFLVLAFVFEHVKSLPPLGLAWANVWFAWFVAVVVVFVLALFMFSTEKRTEKFCGLSAHSAQKCRLNHKCLSSVLSNISTFFSHSFGVHRANEICSIGMCCRFPFSLNSVMWKDYMSSEFIANQKKKNTKFVNTVGTKWTVERLMCLHSS